MDDQNHTGPSATTQCISCKSTINTGAELCPVCSSYQSKWKNKLKFWFPMTSLVVLAIPLITYLWTAIPETFFRDNVNILAFDGNRMTISNDGYGKVYISDVWIKSDDPLIDIAMLRQLSKVLDLGEILRIEVPSYPKERSASSLQFAGNCDDEEWKKYLNRSQDKSNPEFRPEFYLKDGATFARLKAETKGLRTFNGHAELSFYSIRKREYLKKAFKLSGVVLKSKPVDDINPSTSQ